MPSLRAPTAQLKRSRETPDPYRAGRWPVRGASPWRRLFAAPNDPTKPCVAQPPAHAAPGASSPWWAVGSRQEHPLSLFWPQHRPARWVCSTARTCRPAAPPRSAARAHRLCPSKPCFRTGQGIRFDVHQQRQVRSQHGWPMPLNFTKPCRVARARSRSGAAIFSRRSNATAAIARPCRQPRPCLAARMRPPAPSIANPSSAVTGLDKAMAVASAGIPIARNRVQEPTQSWCSGRWHRDRAHDS